MSSRVTLITLSMTVAIGLMSTTPAEASDFTANVQKSVFGEMADGAPIDLYTLTNSQGMQVAVMTYGATITAVKVPDRKGQFENVTLYLDSCDDYLRGHPLFGSVVGRYANRIGGASFPLDGTTYKITPNAGPNHIHGGKVGFQKLVWDAKPTEGDGVVGVRLTHTSPDGHEGYPGEVQVAVEYQVTDKNELRIEYTATTTKPTHVNLTNHAYWNLGGAHSGEILDTEITLNANAYLPTDERKIPTGEIRSVADTVMDFRQSHRIGERIEQVEGKNYDHCYVIDKALGEKLTFAARAVDPKSGRVMEVFTTQPGVQFFTASFLSDRYQADGKPYGPYHGFCLETQHYPDSPNKPDFPSTVLRPGETYRELTVHKFGVLSTAKD